MTERVSTAEFLKHHHRNLSKNDAYVGVNFGSEPWAVFWVQWVREDGKKRLLEQRVMINDIIVEPGIENQVMRKLVEQANREA